MKRWSVPLEFSVRATSPITGLYNRKRSNLLTELERRLSSIHSITPHKSLGFKLDDRVSLLTRTPCWLIRHLKITSYGLSTCPIVVHLNCSLIDIYSTVLVVGKRTKLQYFGLLPLAVYVSFCAFSRHHKITGCNFVFAIIIRQRGLSSNTLYVELLAAQRGPFGLLIFCKDTDPGIWLGSYRVQLTR